MSDGEQLRTLLEEALNSGRTPEEVCAEHPDLLETVRARLLRIRHLAADLDVAFPTSAPAPDRQRRTLGAIEGWELPQIPGYEMEAVVGHGGMGVVYRARHIKLDRVVAVKMLLSGDHTPTRELASLAREAQAVAGLKHPHIVQVHDIGELDGLPYFTMEFVEGGSLARKLDGKPLPAREAAALVATLAAAVQAAHSGGIVHRDLKPVNIMLAADGTPKITDFGLARRTQGDPGRTLSAARLGTPSYMAPEQALGTPGAFGTSVDIYSLGAILYETLTGRPPFRSDSPAETQRQVVEEDPAPPSRLNTRVPRDLETICLKCLSKDPPRRYSSAAALAVDLGRFLNGRPITARPAGPLERGWRWCRRNPRDCALVGLVVVLVLSATAGVWRLNVQRSARRAEHAQQEERTHRAIDGALDQASSMRRLGQWSRATEALDQAAQLIADSDRADWRQSVETARRDLKTAKELDRIRQAKAIITDGKLDTAHAPGDYAREFGNYGLPVQNMDTDLSAPADRMRGSAIEPELVDALNDWIFVEPDPSIQARLAVLAHSVDADTWRDRARQPAAWTDVAELERIAQSAPPRESSVPLLVALGQRLQSAGGNAIAFLRHVQEEHPTDFWASFAVGNALARTDPGEAIGYYRAALAVRPDAVVAIYNLAGALKNSGRLEEALERYRRAAALSPDDAGIHVEFGEALTMKGQHREALEEFELAARLNPQHAAALSGLGVALAQERRFDEAVRSCQAAADLEPDSSWAQGNLGLVLQKAGRMEEALTHDELALKLEPTSGLAHTNLAFVLQALGRPDEAIEHCREALRLDPNDTSAHVNLGLSLVDKGRKDEALEHFREAHRLDPKDPRPLVNLGRGAILNGNPHEAVEYLQQALALDPDVAKARMNLGVALGQLHRQDEAIEQFLQAIRIEPSLAMAHHNLGVALGLAGRFAEARAAFDRALDMYPQDDPRREDAVRKQADCEQFIALELRLPAVLRGDDRPSNAAEILQLAELCRMTKRNSTAVTFYRDAFAASPSLADDLGEAARYNAACAAALAASGVGEDADGFEESDRTQWRNQALQWLRAELSACDRTILDASPRDQAALLRGLTTWRNDPDLASVRDESAVERLLATERGPWQEFWGDVDALVSRAGSPVR